MKLCVVYAFFPFFEAILDLLVQDKSLELCCPKFSNFIVFSHFSLLLSRIFTTTHSRQLFIYLLFQCHQTGRRYQISTFTWFSIENFVSSQQIITPEHLFQILSQVILICIVRYLSGCFRRRVIQGKNINRWVDFRRSVAVQII